MTRRLQHAVISAYVILAVMTMSSIGFVTAQGQFEPQVNALLSSFLSCMDRAAIYGGPQYMPLGLERFTCRALMDNSHAALNHIYNTGTLESYSPATQDLAYTAANIIVQHVLPPGVSSNGGGMSAMGESMSSSLSNSFFDALGSDKSGYLTGGIYGDVCNYTADNCQVTDENTGEVLDVPFSSIPSENIVIDKDPVE